MGRQSATAPRLGCAAGRQGTRQRQASSAVAKQQGAHPLMHNDFAVQKLVASSVMLSTCRPGAYTPAEVPLTSGNALELVAPQRVLLIPLAHAAVCNTYVRLPTRPTPNNPPGPFSTAAHLLRAVAVLVQARRQEAVPVVRQ